MDIADTGGQGIWFYVGALRKVVPEPNPDVPSLAAVAHVPKPESKK